VTAGIKVFIVAVAAIAVVVLLAIFADPGKAATKPFSAYFSGDPACVNATDHAVFPLMVTNTSRVPLNIMVRLAYTVPLVSNDPFGIVVTDGTSHLLGGPGNLYWSFKLLPGQSTTRTLVAVVPTPWAQKGPQLFGVTEFVSVANTTIQTPVISTPAFCGDF
jgi:hypothetical protein